ncbi:MAG: Nif3-like dinuclear metal center hexameric protein [Clostridiales bacterium]|nr:Nif3-like dinuclear metal center hexameric protein [Clostridiales bacterium]
MTTVKEIYDKIDGTAPFFNAEKWDNCGIIVGSQSNKVTKIISTLDITKEAALEAVATGADLVISHHPVIFNPLKNLDDNNPAVILAKNNVSAICMHTNFDLSKNGMNHILCKKLGLKELKNIPLDFEDGIAIGNICDLEHQTDVNHLAETVKFRLGCEILRYNSIKKPIKRVGICSGSGGNYLAGAIKNQCDALITGDVKHSVFVEAQNAGIAVLDAGHFYTEVIFCDWINDFIRANYPEITTFTAQSCKDPCSYAL